METGWGGEIFFYGLVKMGVSPTVPKAHGPEMSFWFPSWSIPLIPGSFKTKGIPSVLRLV